MRCCENIKSKTQDEHKRHHLIFSHCLMAACNANDEFVRIFEALIYWSDRFLMRCIVIDKYRWTANLPIGFFPWFDARILEHRPIINHKLMTNLVMISICSRKDIETSWATINFKWLFWFWRNVSAVRQTTAIVFNCIWRWLKFDWTFRVAKLINYHE